MLGKKGECIACRYFFGYSNPNGLHKHHVFAGGTSGRRQMSDKYDLTVMLCVWHHELYKEAVHNRPNTGLDLWLKQKAQEYYEEHYGTREDFRRDFIKSYL